MNKFWIMLVFVPLLLFPHRAKADVVMVGQIVAIIEGDLMKVLWPGGIEMVQLSTVDAPERGQAFWEDAKWLTADLTIGQQVIIHLKKDDPFGRKWGEIFLKNGLNVSEVLLQSGFAWLRPDYDGNAKLKAMEATARKRKLGLWKDAHPMPPWQFRKTP